MNYYLKNKMNKNKGSTIITTPVIIAIGLMMVASLIVFSVNIITPYIWYEKLSATCIKYVFVMEEYGYLTSKEKDNMIKELNNQGFKGDQLKIEYTSRRQNYGSPIYLRAKYNYKLELPIIGTKNIPINVNRESVSKR